MGDVLDLLLARYVYVLVLVLLAIGLYGVLAKGDLLKKVIGMTIFQTAIYLFFIEGSVKQDATAPVIDPAIGADATRYVDPLPHLLILTAIVVGVGVVGVALSLLVRMHRAHGSLDEEVVAARLAGARVPWGASSTTSTPTTGHVDDAGTPTTDEGRPADGPRPGDR